MEMTDIDRCTAAVGTELAEWLAEEGARLLEERSDWTRSIAQALRNAGPLLPVKFKAPAPRPTDVVESPVVDNVVDIDFDRDGVNVPGLVPPPNDEIDLDLA